MSLKKNLEQISLLLPKTTRLLVASKYACESTIEELFHLGVRYFGENKLQDAEKKINALAHLPIEWHFIGHLQTNKVNKAIRLFDCIQSVDSLKLLEKISLSCAEINKTQTLLLQVNIANDKNKFGFTKEELLSSVQTIQSFQNIDVQGMMVMIPYSEDTPTIRSYFSDAQILHNELKNSFPSFHILSMGMSNDFKLAIEYGSTCVRIGRHIFS
jgi:pyridoxal phosphate enzyme (YggS family)